MRDLAVALAIFATLPFILARPYIGVLVWSWIGYMNPHRLAWGFAVTMPWAQMVAACTLIGLLFSREPKRIPVTREVVVLLVFIAWMLLTTVTSLYPWLAWPQWDKVWKIQLMTFVTLMLINDRRRLDLLVWVIALSLAFYGVKGGIFVLSTGGAHRVLGPHHSFIGDRNSLGLALIMAMPLLRYLQLQLRPYWARLGMTAVMAFTFIGIIGTHSRGALVGIVAMFLFFLLKTRRRFSAILFVIPLVLSVPYLMPEIWFERMETIEAWEQDKSASERVRAWGNAVQLANERFLGGGYRALVIYGERDAHSIFFGVLGEHGWVGLGLFLLLGFFTWRSASWIIRQTKREPELHWARDLAAMIQVSLIGYAAAGSFLALQYFDLYYHLVAIVVATRSLVAQELAAKATQPEETGVVPDIAMGSGGGYPGPNRGKP